MNKMLDPVARQRRYHTHRFRMPVFMIYKIIVWMTSSNLPEVHQTTGYTKGRKCHTHRLRPVWKRQHVDIMDIAIVESAKICRPKAT